MPTILETTEHMRDSKEKISLTKTRASFTLSASSNKGSNVFHNVRIDLSKIPTISTGKTDGPICIDLNVDKLRRSSSGFVPKFVILSGSALVRKLKDKDVLSCNAWVGNRVLDKYPRIMADDAISSSDLSEKLRCLISKTYTKPSTRDQDGCYAYVVDIYPFENYLIFSIKNEKYRQQYKLDPIAREVALDGKPVKVFEKYVDAVVPSSSVTTRDPLSSSSIDIIEDKRNFAAPALGGVIGNNIPNPDVMTNYGALGSELNNPQLKQMLNVEEALTMYRTETASGIHKVIYTPYAPVPPGLINAAKEAKIAVEAAGIALDKFSIYDFLRWQDHKLRMKAAIQRKYVNGEPLTFSAFAYVGEIRDTSTWHLAMHSASAIKKAIKEISEIKLVPKSFKAEALKILQHNLAAAGGPHLGKGTSATKHIKEMNAKKKCAVCKQIPCICEK
jgi:hypothetical protein